MISLFWSQVFRISSRSAAATGSSSDFRIVAERVVYGIVFAYCLAPCGLYSYSIAFEVNLPSSSRPYVCFFLKGLLLFDFCFFGYKVLFIMFLAGR